LHALDWPDKYIRNINILYRSGRISAASREDKWPDAM
jgi:hypothetical protein